MKTSLTILTIILICMACKKNNDKLSSVDGIWTEASKQKDTLYFESQTSFVDLRRGKELRNGYFCRKFLLDFIHMKLKKIAFPYSFYYLAYISPQIINLIST